tara:strand:+ start:876 stop:1178 length:303 start_codon:yes stop_codon:yes gene_type:complete
MNTYQKAIKALEDCIKDAMENDLDAALQCEIWRHYQGMKGIERQLPKEKKFSFKLDSIDDLLTNIDIPPGPYAADTISISTGSDDVITFDDYKSQEYRFD